MSNHPRKHYHRTPVLAAIGLCMATGILVTPAQANLVISPVFDSSIIADANAAAIESVINAAIGTFEQAISTPITVTIGFAEMSSGLGSNTSYYAQISYSSYIAALRAHASDATDATALTLLPQASANPVTGSQSIDVKTANLRALGLNINPPPGSPDGTVSLNTSITTPGSSGSSLVYSLLSVAEHEIDEVLGLGSGLGALSTIMPEDLFRYTASGARSYSASDNAYFSLNGTTDLAQFNNGGNGGDYGDWASNPLPSGTQPQVQDAFATPYTSPTLGPVELTALNVIGYDVAPVPEPASVGVIGCALVGLVLSRRRRGR